MLQCSSTSSSQLSCSDQSVRLQAESGSGNGKLKHKYEYLVCDYGWRVRRLVENADEIRKAVQVQAQAFHVPVPLFDHLFFQFFQVLLLFFPFPIKQIPSIPCSFCIFNLLKWVL